jgi:hypothetical protein
MFLFEVVKLVREHPCENHRVFKEDGGRLPAVLDVIGRQGEVVEELADQAVLIGQGLERIQFALLVSFPGVPRQVNRHLAEIQRFRVYFTCSIASIFTLE